MSIKKSFAITVVENYYKQNVFTNLLFFGQYRKGQFTVQENSYWEGTNSYLFTFFMINIQSND